MNTPDPIASNNTVAISDRHNVKKLVIIVHPLRSLVALPLSIPLVEKGQGDGITTNPTSPLTLCLGSGGISGV